MKIKEVVVLLPIPQNSDGEEPIKDDGTEMAVIIKSKKQEIKKREFLSFELFTKKDNLPFKSFEKNFTYKGIAIINRKKMRPISLFASFVLNTNKTKIEPAMLQARAHKYKTFTGCFNL